MTVWLEDTEDTRWLNIEKFQCQQPLSELPFLDGSLGKTEMGVWTLSTLKIWREIQSTFKLPKSVCSLTSIGSLKDFIPAQLDAGFKRWSKHGLNYIHQLFEGDTLKSFEKLSHDFHLPSTDFFKYLQLRHTLTKHKDWDKIIKPTSVETYLGKIQLGNGRGRLISAIYQAFSSMNQINSTHIKERWGTETQKEISNEDWEQICLEAHRVTNANIWREFKWKVIVRYFRTPQITAKMSSTHTNKCWRNCGDYIGNHLHIFWSCSKLQQFWEEVYQALKEVFHVDIPQDPQIALLGLKPKGEIIEGRAATYLLQIMLTAALKCITINWLKTDPPTYNQWIQRIWEIHVMEQITYSLRLKKNIFVKRWSPIMKLLIQ